MLKELPEKWCIKDCTEVSLYASIKYHPCSNVVGPNFLHIDSTKYGDIQYGFFEFKQKEYKELTINEFRVLVLKPIRLQDIRTRIKNLKI